jgi:hypothetical protein
MTDHEGALQRLKRDIVRRFSGLPAPIRSLAKLSALLISLLAVFFYRTLLFGQLPSAASLLAIWPAYGPGHIPVQNGLFGDVVMQFEPWFILSYDMIRGLQVPLWNPYSAAGVPLMANMQSAVFSFLAWPLYALGISSFSLLLYYSSKLFLTGIFSYYYFRAIKLDPWSSLAGAIGFMFVGYNIVWLYWPHSSEIFLLPALLWLVEKLVRKDMELKYLPALAVFTALGIFLGHPETFFHLYTAVFLYFMFRVMSGEEGLREKAVAVMKYGVFSFLGFLLSAIQLLPFLEYLSNSHIWAARNAFGQYADWRTAIANIIPWYYGSPSILQPIPYYVPFTNFNESTSAYVGITLLCLAAFALLTRYRDSLVRFYFILGLWAAAVVYGCPVIFDLTASLPLFSHAANTRLLFLLGFCTVALGALGMNALICPAGGRKQGIPARLIGASLLVSGLLIALYYENAGLLAAFSAASAFAGTRAVLIGLAFLLIAITAILAYLLVNGRAAVRRSAAVCILALIFIETGVAGALYEPVADQQNFYPPVAAFDDIRGDGLYRATCMDTTAYSTYPVNIQAAYGIYDIRNYDAMDIRYYRELLDRVSTGSMVGSPNLAGVDHRFLDLTGVRWIFSTMALDKAAGISVMNNTRPVGEITAGTVVEQRFVAGAANLSMVKLLLATYDRPTAGLTVELIDDGAGAVVMHRALVPGAIDNNRWNTFEFAPRSDSRGKSYTLRVTGDGSPGKSATIWMDGDMKDPALRLSVNGTELPGSLCIITYYDKEGGDYRLWKDRGDYRIFENPDALPRAFMAWNATLVDDDGAGLEALTAPGFDWRTSVILAGKNATVSLPPGNADVEVLDYGPSYVKINVNSTAAGYLVLSDAYYPGWNAYVNGAGVDILRADHAFRSVMVGPGESVVEFKYEPASFTAGALLSLLGALVLLAIALKIIKSH